MCYQKLCFSLIIEAYSFKFLFNAAKICFFCYAIEVEIPNSPPT